MVLGVINAILRLHKESRQLNRSPKARLII